MKKPAASLSAGLIAKGAAVPTPAVAGDLLSSGPAASDTQVAKSVSAYHKALTLKLDEARYRRLKTAGLDLDMSSQDILVQALDQWLSQQDAERRVSSNAPLT